MALLLTMHFVNRFLYQPQNKRLPRGGCNLLTENACLEKILKR